MNSQDGSLAEAAARMANQSGMAKPPEPDWRAIAQEIWDDYDNVALFLEQYTSEKAGCQFPFLEKNLSRRFKHFNRVGGATVTSAEYKEHQEKQRLLTESLFKTFSKQAPNP